MTTLTSAPNAHRFPTVEALDALFIKTTSKPLWLPPDLLRYLKLKRDIDLTQVRRKDAMVTLPRGALPNCRACTNSCCVGKENTVSLRLVDIARLIDLGRTDLIATEQPNLAQVPSTMARRRFMASRSFAVFPVLKQDANHRCLALSADSRCSLHPHWPLSCARFPYSLDRDDNEVFYSSRCGSAEMYYESADVKRCEVMIDATLNAYNQRIRDFVLLEYARPALDALGLTRYLAL